MGVGVGGNLVGTGGVSDRVFAEWHEHDQLLHQRARTAPTGVADEIRNDVERKGGIAVRRTFVV